MTKGERKAAAKRWSAARVIADAAPNTVTSSLPITPTAEPQVTLLRGDQIQYDVAARELAATPHCPAHVLDALATRSTSLGVLCAIANHPNITEQTAVRVADTLIDQLPSGYLPAASPVAALSALAGSIRPSVYMPKLVAARRDIPVRSEPLKELLAALADDSEYLAAWNSGHPGARTVVLAAAIVGDTSIDAEALWLDAEPESRTELLNSTLIELLPRVLPHWVVDEVVSGGSETTYFLQASVCRHPVDRYAAQSYLGCGSPWLVSHAIEAMNVEDSDLVDDALLDDVVASDSHTYTRLFSLFGERVTETHTLTLLKSQGGYEYGPFSDDDARLALTSRASDTLVVAILGKIGTQLTREWLAGLLNHPPNGTVVAALAAADGQSIAQFLYSHKPAYLEPSLAQDLLGRLGTDLFTDAVQSGWCGIPAETVAAYTHTRLAELGTNPDTWAVAVNLVESMHAETVDDFIAAAITITS